MRSLRATIAAVVTLVLVAIAPPVAHAAPTPRPELATGSSASSFSPLAADAAADGSGYLIGDRDAVMALPMAGGAWASMLKVADGGLGRAALSDQNNVHAGQTVAAALVYARTGDAAYRDKVVAQLRQVPSSSLAEATSLSVGRQLAGYVIAADLVGHRERSFVDFVDRIRTQDLGNHGRWRSVSQTSENTANNWGAWALASRIAASAYVGDTADVAESARIFRGFTGDRSAYAGFETTVDFNPTWVCGNPASWVPINPASCGDRGGAIVEDISRSQGDYPGVDDAGLAYSWETLGGATLSAELLSHAGYPDVYQWGDRALLRAAEFLHRRGGYPAPYSANQYIPWAINNAYGTALGPLNPAGHGRQFGFTDWLQTRHPSTPPAPPRPPVPGDPSPPSTPNDLEGSISALGHVSLAWTASTDNVGVVAYTIRRDGEIVGTTATTDFMDTSVAPEKTFRYTVSASDAAGNVSAESRPVAVTTPPTQMPPSKPGITLRGTSTAANDGANTLALRMPPTTAGDVVLASIDVRGGPEITAPAGWQLLRIDADGNVARKATYWRAVGEGEPAAYTWSLSSEEAAVGTAIAYSGVSTSAPVEVHGGGLDSADGTLHAPSVMTTSPNAMVVVLFAAAGTVTVTPPVGMSQIAEQSAHDTVQYALTGHAAQARQVLPGATGIKTAILSTPVTGVGQVLALRPKG
jgi:chitodextrinase